MTSPQRPVVEQGERATPVVEQGEERARVETTPHHTEVRFARVPDVLVGSGGHLTATELARNARLRHPADRDAHLAAHLLVRRVASRVLGVSPDEIEIGQRCPECGSTEHGRPHVVGEPGLFVSLSHTRDRVAAIAAHDPCGIDVEPVRAVADAVRHKVLSGAELRQVHESPDPATTFTRLWVAKEAMVKAGLGRLTDAGSWSALAAPTLRQWSGSTTSTTYVGAWLVTG